MKSEQELIDLAEAFFRGELSAEALSEFEALRNGSTEIDQKVVAHLSLMRQLAEYGEQQKLKAELDSIHADLDIAKIRREVLPNEVVVKRLWAKHRFNVGIAASVALFTLVSTLMFMGYFSPNTDYVELRDKIDDISKVIRTNKGGAPVRQSRRPVNPGKYRGTGFVLSANYLATSYHIIKGADSLYIENANGDAFKVRVVHTDPAFDVAILQVTDSSFPTFGALPYSIKKSMSDPAEDVFTIGFPGGKQVYNMGYLSSTNGYNGDTTAYQASISVNMGNSGSPLMDSRGNIIGLVKGSQLRADGVVFATKSNILLKTIDEISPDSLNGAIVLSKKNKLAGLKRTEQVKKMEKYIFQVKAY